MKQVTIDYTTIANLANRLRNAVNRYNKIETTDDLDDKLDTARKQLAELAVDPQADASDIMRLSSQIKTLSDTKERTDSHVEDALETIGKLKYLINEELAKVDVDERPCELSDFITPANREVADGNA
ncbi:hypothetical protein HPC37_03000 [Pasteurellaceae bacterium 20609_3]|uniref:hypothetical protein n=1 Tax=Spirabiliibacterium mucosae TaxID=28156 RepID=UPI001AAD0A19|nr:hypothetical protein [Spirabiliibacterium mucosae]MBE2897822.1 hypothetical protein [Spirabiliibacterium mucosae]